MVVPTVIFRDNDETAHAVHRYISDLRPSLQRFTLRPYQHQAPKFTQWWLAPSTEWPAYRFSKLCFHQHGADSKYLYTGFYVEQGLGAEVAGLPDVKSRNVMKPDWCWREFLLQARDGELDAPLREVLERSECPVIVSADVYEFNRVPDTAEEHRNPDDVVEFAIRSADLRFELAAEGTKVLAALNGSMNLRELGRCLEGLSDLRWYWVGLIIGIRVRYGDESRGTWGAAQIWHNALEPWTPWVCGVGGQPSS